MIKMIRTNFNCSGRRFISGDKVIIQDNVIYHIYLNDNNIDPNKNDIEIDKVNFSNFAELEKLIIQNS